MIILIIWIVLLLVGFYGFLYCLGSAFGAGFELCAGATLYVGSWIAVGTLLYYTVKEIAKHIC